MRPRIRTIKPEFFRDEKLAGLSIEARYLMVGLITMADDEGRTLAGAISIAGHCFPFEPQAIKRIPRWLDELAETGVILLYEAKGIPYVAIRSWAKHQRINRPTPSDLPPPPDAEVVAQNSVAGWVKASRPRISDAVRRAVARAAGAIPGEVVDVECHYCQYVGRVHWRRLSNGKPGSWVTFEGLELDHVFPVNAGGEGTVENLVLACTRCNREKGASTGFRTPVTESRTDDVCDPVDDVSRAGARSAPFLKEEEESSKDKDELDAREIFDAWVAATGRDTSRTKLDVKRRRVIVRALASHGREDCLAAVRNIGRDEWASGRNDRGRRFDDVEHALGSAERIERWRDWTGRAASLPASRVRGPVGRNPDGPEITRRWVERQRALRAEAEAARAQ